MSTVQQILTQVQTQFPNSFSNTELLTWGNEVLRKIWKWMNEDGIYTFNLIANQATYSLPTDGLDLEKIAIIEIAEDSSLEEWDSYKFRGLLNEFDSSKYFYDAYNGIFGIYPVPTASITDGGKIYYGSKFTLMSASDLTATPKVSEDHHGIIVDYICMKAADSGKRPNIGRRNNFAKAYNDGISAMLFDVTRKKTKLPTKKRSSAWWR